MTAPATNEPKDQASQHVDELKEKLAAIEHERWSDWQKWVHKQLELHEDANGTPHWCLPPEAIDAWESQIATPYDNLSEREQASDMEQVDRYWPLIEALLAQFTQELIEGLPKKKRDSNLDCVYTSHPDCEVHRPPLPHEAVNFGDASAFNEAVDAATQSIKAVLTKYTGEK